VSHDLRNPAGQVKGFAELLREDPQSRLSERGATYVKHIESAAADMLALIEHLLRLARLSRQPLQRTTTDLTAMIDDIVTVHRHNAKDRIVDVRVAPGMSCECDAGLLRVVLDNLIGNAFKYSSKRAEAHIDIGCGKDVDGGTVFYVRDDGAGFDATKATKLFTPFARMHNNSEFPGTGIGLATAQRIIDRHGGRIWVKSAPGDGATFYFTLGQSPSRAAQ
jgi:signal transduction histidine kinase